MEALYWAVEVVRVERWAGGLVYKQEWNQLAD